MEKENKRKISGQIKSTVCFLLESRVFLKTRRIHEGFKQEKDKILTRDHSESCREKA